MRIDLRASAYPSLLEAVGLAVISCDGMEKALPAVFQSALNCSLSFRNDVFAATRGLETHISLITAAVLEGAPAFLDRWKELARRIGTCAQERGNVAHAGLSIHGGGVVIELDENDNPTGVVRREGPPVASLARNTKSGREQISESDVRALAARLQELSREITQLAHDILISRIPLPSTS